MKNDNIYYVYALVNPIDKRIFYIGKGHGKRMYRHYAIVKNGRDKHSKTNGKLYSYIKNIKDKGYMDLEYEVIGESLNEVEAFALEAAAIEFYRDTIFNISKGGKIDSSWLIGTKRSEETKRKIRESVKVSMQSPENIFLTKYGRAKQIVGDAIKKYGSWEKYWEHKWEIERKKKERQRIVELNKDLNLLNEIIWDIQCELQNKNQ